MAADEEPGDGKDLPAHLEHRRLRPEGELLDRARLGEAAAAERGGGHAGERIRGPALGPLPSPHGYVRRRSCGRAGVRRSCASVSTDSRSARSSSWRFCRERSRRPTKRAASATVSAHSRRWPTSRCSRSRTSSWPGASSPGAGGLLFGTAVGWPLALAGVTLAALAQMAVARRLAKDHAGKLLPEADARSRELPAEQRDGRSDGVADRAVPALRGGQLRGRAHSSRLPRDGGGDGHRRRAQGVRLRGARRQHQQPLGRSR